MILFINSGEHRFLSNDYFAKFCVGRLPFSSITQFMAYCKARMFGDKAAANEIFNYGNDRLRVMRLERTLKGDQEQELKWNGQREVLMCKALKAKFDNNPALITKLVKTGSEILACCESDPVFGIGYYQSDPEASEMAKWTGQNRLGFALMELRAEYQAQMPESLRLMVQGRLSQYSPPDIIDILNGENFVMEEYECDFKPYEGDDPYIYLNYSLRDIRVAYKTVEELTRMGFHVWYDKYLMDGRLWRGERSDAIEKCFLMIVIEDGEENVSHVKYFARRFAEQCEIPTIEIAMDHSRYRKEEPYDPEAEMASVLLRANVEDRTFREKCLAILAKNGLTPGMKYPEDAKRPLATADPFIFYCDEFGEDMEFYKRTVYRCNLRTREVFWPNGSRRMREIGDGFYKEKSEEPMYMTDEELYRASVWLSKELDALRKSGEPEYIGGPEDWAFAARLAGLRGALVPEIADQYRRMQKQVDKAIRDYPYMDEFEYLSSKFDE